MAEDKLPKQIADHAETKFLDDRPFDIRHYMFRGTGKVHLTRILISESLMHVLFFRIKDVLQYFHISRALFDQYQCKPAKYAVFTVKRNHTNKYVYNELFKKNNYKSMDFISSNMLYYTLLTLMINNRINHDKAERFLDMLDRSDTIIPNSSYIIQLAQISRHKVEDHPMSHGEKRIAQFLRSWDVSFKYGYVMYDNLHLDFYLPKEKTGIEFDGQQHFKPVAKFGGKSTWMRQCQNDKRKELYCHTHHIKLIRIPYWDFDKIGKILKQKLNIKKAKK